MSAIGYRAASGWIFTASGIWLLGLGLYFIVVRPPLLPEDVRFMGTSIGQARAALPGLEGWLQRVFTVLGGFIAGAGVLTVLIARGSLWARFDGTALAWAMAIAGTFTVGLMSATNFALHSDFEWLLLVPALAWSLGVMLLMLAAVARRNEPGSNRYAEAHQ